LIKAKKSDHRAATLQILSYAISVRKLQNDALTDPISDALAFGRLWYGDANAVANAIGCAKHHSRTHRAVIRVYDAAGNVIETHKHKSEFKEW
jgi:hypothetical protein